jgi:hypothetical protein
MSRLLVAYARKHRATAEIAMDDVERARDQQQHCREDDSTRTVHPMNLLADRAA